MISLTGQHDVGSHVAAVYDAMQAEYDQLEDQFYFAECYEVYRQCVERITRSRPRGLALDLGCGTGKQTTLLARRAGPVIGIDISERMIEAARKRCELHSNVGFVTGDITRLPFEDGCAQALLAYGDVIGHNFTAVEVVLREMVRVCAPGGFISFEVDSKWCPDLLYLPKELWRAMITRGGHLREWKGMQFKTFTWRELRRVLRSHRLRLDEVRSMNILTMLIPPSLLFRRREEAPRFDACFRPLMKLDLALGKVLRCGSTRIVTVEKLG
jgi:ubiquinone/menaquinone biosynthesis C-methylase UbiE